MQDRYIELLTGFIDGELTRRERLSVLRLLNQSSEARSVLWQLQQNSQLVKGLPVKSSPADLSGRIVDTINKIAAASPAQPAAAAAPAASRWGGRVAVRLAWAAGLLLAVGGSLFYVLHNPEKPPEVVKNETPPGEPPPAPRQENPPAQETPKVNPPADTPKVVPEKPRPFASRTVFAELKKEPQRKLLEEELKLGKAFRMDLYAKNGRQALAKLGSQLQFDLPTNPKKNKDKQLSIFVENLLPADVAGMLGELARDEKGPFEHLQLQPLSAADQKVLCALMEIKPDALSQPVERIRFPDIIADKNKNPLPPPPEPVVPKVPERRAVLLVKDDSGQIRKFVDQRRPLKDGTVQVLFVLHAQTQPLAWSGPDSSFLVHLGAPKATP